VSEGTKRACEPPKVGERGARADYDWRAAGTNL